MPSHFSHREKGILSQSSPVANKYHTPVGAALALKMDKTKYCYGNCRRGKFKSRRFS